ncbi:unnamed protein product [Closterium sp. NIES-65]|nr:unnamed protein product [Closterium sp. NIES-65]
MRPAIFSCRNIPLVSLLLVLAPVISPQQQQLVQAIKLDIPLEFYRGDSKSLDIPLPACFISSSSHSFIVPSHILLIRPVTLPSSFTPSLAPSLPLSSRPLFSFFSPFRPLRSASYSFPSWLQPPTPPLTFPPSSPPQPPTLPPPPLSPLFPPTPPLPPPAFLHQLNNYVTDVYVRGVDCAGRVMRAVPISDLSASNVTGNFPKLKGPFSFDIAAVIFLKTLNLAGNKLHGAFPSELALSPSLAALNVANNSLTGRLSEDLCNLNLTCVNVMGNPLRGPIPSCWRNFTCQDCNPPLAVAVAPPSAAASSVNVVAIIAGVVGGAAFIALVVAGAMVVMKHIERKRREEEERRLEQDLETQISSRHFGTQKKFTSAELKKATNRFDEDYVLGEWEGAAQISSRHFGTLRRFTSEELKKATNGFDEDYVLGEGGFSKVYKGKLEDGKFVAIKRIKDEKRAGGELQFLSEVEMISRAVHRNLIRAEGFCVERGECMLVLPFCSNGSVASRTQGKEGNPMDWPTRMKVARGAAEGIGYLHTDCKPKLVHRDIKGAAERLASERLASLRTDCKLKLAHRDIKSIFESTQKSVLPLLISCSSPAHPLLIPCSSPAHPLLIPCSSPAYPLLIPCSSPAHPHQAANVLLDENDEAVIADFGLAKEMDVNETHATTAVKGTIGHIAPEYFVSGQCSEKTDVYAFGVFLLELVSGKDVYGLTVVPEAEEILLRDWLVSGKDVYGLGSLSCLRQRRFFSGTGLSPSSCHGCSRLSLSLLDLVSGKDMYGLWAVPEAEEILLSRLGEWVHHRFNPLFLLMTHLSPGASLLQVSQLLVEGKADVLVDPEVKKAEGAVDMGQVEKMLQVALLCLKNDPAERPTMEDVAKMVAGSELTEKWQQWQVRGVG